MKQLSLFLILVILTIKIVLANSPLGQNELKSSRSLFDNNSNFLAVAISDSGQIKVIKNYSKISSIPELLDHFKGKPVFIDLWATWCTPCFKEFEFSKALNDFLRKRRVEIIYVSFDKAANELIWRKKIRENKLSGNHIIANKTLQDSLTTLIWGGIGAYSIPHYLLFNRNNKLINRNLSPPSSGVILFKEIEAGLKQHSEAKSLK